MKDLRQHFVLDIDANLKFLHSRLKVMEEVTNMAAMSFFAQFKTSYG